MSFTTPAAVFDAKEKLMEKFPSASVAIVQLGFRRYGLKVNFQSEAEMLVERPEQIDNFPIQYEVVGKISAS